MGAGAPASGGGEALPVAADGARVVRRVALILGAGGAGGCGTGYRGSQEEGPRRAATARDGRGRARFGGQALPGPAEGQGASDEPP
jgi:hypothetical protein